MKRKRAFRNNIGRVVKASERLFSSKPGKPTDTTTNKKRGRPPDPRAGRRKNPVVESGKGSKNRGYAGSGRCLKAIGTGPVLPQGRGVKSRSTAENKARFLKLYFPLLGNVTEICRRIGISRDRIYEWAKVDPDFKAKWDQASEGLIDFAESKLLKLIDEKNVAAVIFFLKTKAKSRGYIERLEVEPGDKPARFEITFNGTKPKSPARISSESTKSGN